MRTRNLFLLAVCALSIVGGVYVFLAAMYFLIASDTAENAT
jgi:small neutral amino acid transporter SnatA (MarC family)